MRQATLVADRRFEVGEAAEPAADGVLLEVSRVGVCGSDLHVYHGRHPKVRAPVVLGHECVGTVRRTTYGGPEEGAPAVVFPLVACGRCAHCAAGGPNLCLDRKVVGFQRPGGLADLISLPAENVVPLPHHLDPRTATLAEPLAVAAHAASLASVEPGAPAVVTGAGPIGLLVGLHVREAFGATVRFVEIDPRRAEFARRLGFEAVEVASDPRLGVGPENGPVVFECTGRPEVVGAVLDLVPAPAQLVLVGTFGREAKVGLHQLAQYETRVVASQMYTRNDVVRAVEVLAGPGGVGYARLVSGREYPLEEVGLAFEEAARPEDGVKVQIRVGGWP